MYFLGKDYEEYPDKIEAYKWYGLAVTHPSAMERQSVNGRDRVAQSLTAGELQEAERRIVAWKPGDCGERPTDS